MMSIIGNTVTNVKIMSLDPRTSPYVDLQVSLLYTLTLNSTGSQWVAVLPGVAVTPSPISTAGHWVQNDGCHKAIITRCSHTG